MTNVYLLGDICCVVSSQLVTSLPGDEISVLLPDGDNEILPSLGDSNLLFY